MELLASSYWRDRELAGLQFTANRFVQREIRAHRHGGYTLSVSDTELHVRTSAGVTVVPPGALLRIGPQVWHSIKARSTPWREDAMYCSVAVARCVNPVPEADDGIPGAEPAPVSVFACEPWGREFSQCHRLLHEIADTGREDAGIAARALVRRLLAQWIPLQAGRTTESGEADDRLRRSYGLIATGYISSVVAATALKNLGDKKIKLVGIDDDKIILDGIRDGFVAGTMAQNPYGQAYIGAYVLDQMAAGCSVKADAPWIATPQTAHFVDSGTLLISEKNVDSYKDDLKALTKKLQGSFKDTYLSCK